MSDKTFQSPGTKGIDEIWILSPHSNQVKSVATQLQSLSITESIDKRSMQGTLTLNDVSDVLNEQGYQGAEWLGISWKSESYLDEEHPDRTHLFRISSITNITPNSQNTAKQYNISFMSEAEFACTFAESVSQYYAKPVNEIVQDVWDTFVGETKEKIIDTEAGDKINIDETEGSAHVIVPRKAPLDAIEFLAAFAYKADSSSTYMFFQNADGYNFRLLDKLFKDGIDEIPEDEKYNYGAFEATSVSGRANYNMTRFTQLQRNNLWQLADKGKLHNQVVEIDFVTQSVNVNTVNVAEEMGSYSEYKFNKPLNSDDKYFGEKYNQDPTESNYIYADGLSHYMNRPDMLPRKWAFMDLMYNNMIGFTVPGNSRLSAGKVIDVKIGTQDNKTETNDGSVEIVDDPVLSGHYIIKDIIHTFIPNQYTCNIIACRPGPGSGDYNGK